jgi:signal transduction histidine kinase
LTALLAFAVAVFCAVLSTRTWAAGRSERARVALLVFGWTLALAYTAFATSLLPGLHDARAVYMLSGLCVPATALWAFDAALARPDAPRSREIGLAAMATAVAAPLLTGLDLALTWRTPGLTALEVGAGLFVFLGLLLPLRRLWTARAEAPLRVARTRLTWLFAIAVGAVLATLAELAGRTFVEPDQLAGLSLRQRDLALQGAVPPISPLLSAVTLYLLNHVVTAARLLDLRELVGRVAALVVSAVLLLVVDALTFLWIDTFATWPLHSAYQIFLASLVFLAAYDPLLRDRIAWAVQQLVHPTGRALLDTLDQLRQALPGVLDRRALAETLLDGLHETGRAPAAALWLWDADRQVFRCAGHRPLDAPPPVPAFPAGALVPDDAPWLLADALRRDDPRRDMLDAMGASVATPLRRAGVVHGWLGLRHDATTDGWSYEELARLRDTCLAASTALANIREFQAHEEAVRLAALGTMAAGLAHEIRNPLAGMKGAAQYLLVDGRSDRAREMLEVIVSETDRLDDVVSRFLDYARPLELKRAAEDLDQLVGRVLVLQRAEGLPPDLQLTHAQGLAGAAVVVDGPLLTQVLWNLVRNAVQASGRSGHVRVQTAPGPDGRTVEITVSDTGPGIPPDVRARLFTPFVTTRDRGTGLGLPIAQRIVRAHQGELGVRSVEGAGTTFTVVLPAA